MIKVGICVAYDWYLLEYSLPIIYEHADKICLSIDRDRISWSGNKFTFDETAFSEFIARTDKDKKIQLHEEDFHIVALTPMQNEVRQRNRLAAFMGDGGWHIQLDCDEYFVEFPRFVKYLKSLPEKNGDYNVCCLWVTLFKKVEGGFLYITPSSAAQFEYIQIATQRPLYENGRRNGNFNLYTNFLIIHQSWARSEDEISQKILNWGHANDFDLNQFDVLWKNLDHLNYKQLENFHPISPQIWGALNFHPATGIDELMKSFKNSDFPSLARWQLIRRNSRFMAKLEFLWKKITNGS